MVDDEAKEEAKTLTSFYLDLAIRLALVAGLLTWSFIIIRPFVSPVLWGAVIAVTVSPYYEKVRAILGNRGKTTAALFVVVPLLLLSAPIAWLVQTLVTDILVFNEAYKAGAIVIPPPFDGLQDWPLIGRRLHEIWAAAQEDLPATIGSFTPQLLELRGVFVGFLRDLGSVLVKLLFSLLVMAIFLYKEEGVVRTVSGLCTRVAGASGEHLMSLARDTTRSVIKGVLGVAVVQAALGGMGCVVVGVPGASVWTILLLVLAVAQLPVVILLGPITAYVYYHNSFLVTVLFGAWVVFVSAIDNVLKPILLGQGVAAPMLVVFLGAIGGMLSSGVLGLFVGPVVLVVTYTLVRTWANLAPAPHQVMEPLPGQEAPVLGQEPPLHG